jgi:hypothetical protein
MLYTLEEVNRPGERTAYQVRDPHGRLVVELYDYITIERIVSRLNAHAKSRTHALGHNTAGYLIIADSLDGGK